MPLVPLTATSLAHISNMHTLKSVKYPVQLVIQQHILYHILNFTTARWARYSLVPRPSYCLALVYSMHTHQQPRTQAFRSGYCLAALEKNRSCETKSGTESLGSRLTHLCFSPLSTRIVLKQNQIRSKDKTVSTDCIYDETSTMCDRYRGKKVNIRKSYNKHDIPVHTRVIYHNAP